MIKAKLYGIYWVWEENLKNTISDFKEDGFKTKVTGGSFGDFEVEVNLSIQGKTLRGFITDLERKIVKFSNWGIDIYSLIYKNKPILTEEFDFPKLRDLIYLNDEEFLKSYFYINKEDLDFDKARAFEFLKEVFTK